MLQYVEPSAHLRGEAVGKCDGHTGRAGAKEVLERYHLSMMCDDEGC